MAVGKPIDLSEYDVPGRGHGILDVFRRSYLLRILIQKGTATRYRNSVLGWVWSYVKPAAQFVIYYVVMGRILGMHRDVPDFAIYLFAGVVAVNLFNEAFGNATSAIVDNRALVKKIYLPRELFPIASVIGAFIHFLPQLAILIVVILFTGWAPSLTALGGIVLGIVLVMMWSLALGLFFAGLNVRFRDAQNFVDLIKMFSTWTSPVLYTWVLVKAAVPDQTWLFTLYSWNPVTVAVELFHAGFWAPTIDNPDAAHGLMPGFGTAIIAAFTISLVVLVAGQLVFRHFERTFAQDL